jgi:hypothetical protein
MVIRDKPRRSTPRIYGRTLTVRHPWVEGHMIRIGIGRVPAKDVPAFLESLEKLCVLRPARIEDCPDDVVPAVSNAYFAPLARVRLPRVSVVVGEVLRASLSRKVPRHADGRFETGSVDAIRRLAEKSVREHLPADADVHAENERLRAEVVRLQRRVEELTAALKAKTDKP